MVSLCGAEKGRFSPIRLFVYLLICLICAAAFFALGKVSVITIYDKDDSELYSFAFDKGDEFTIRFTHSWNRTPIEEIYRIGDSGLELQETLYEDFGAGLQSYEEPGEKMEVVNNKVRISGIRRSVPNLTYRVGQVIANHSLVLKGEETPLSFFVKPGSPIRFKLTETQRWRLWRYLIHD